MQNRGLLPLHSTHNFNYAPVHAFLHYYYYLLVVSLLHCKLHEGRDQVGLVQYINPGVPVTVLSVFTK